jgi:hypothetical protein
MRYSSKRLIVLAVGLCLLSLLLSFPVQSEERYDIHNDLVAFAALEYTGVINQLPPQNSAEGAKIIIDDTVYQLKNDVILRNQGGRLIGLSSFAQGMSVNFFVVEETLITKMWQVEQDGEDEQVDSQQEIGGNIREGGEEIRLEDGVWRN